MTMRYAHLAPEHLQEARALNPLAQMAAGRLTKAASAEATADAEEGVTAALTGYHPAKPAGTPLTLR
jgi:hypothetical protein